jgi:hypothetical protein
MTVNAFLRASALAAFLLPALALAQQPAAPAPAPGPALRPAPAPAPALAQPALAQPGATGLSPAAAAAIEQRINALKERLGITAAQAPAWDAFAQTMRANTTSTDTLFAQRSSGAAAMTAPENMHSYAEIARAYADNTERLATAFDTLYAGLSDQQKAAADTLFREQATQAQKPASR